MEIVVQSGGGVLTVAIKVPWFLKLNAIHALDVHYAAQFTQALEAMAARGIAQWIH